MVKWYESVVAALDFETTGLDPLGDRVVQAAFVIEDGDGEILEGSWYGLLNPGIQIPREAAAIHGITTAQIRANGHEPREVFTRIADGLNLIGQGDTPLVIFNAPFDWPFLLAELKRHGLRAPVTPKIVDPLTIDRAVDKYRKGRRNLETMAPHYNVLLDIAHDAAEDAMASIRVARKLGELFLSIGDADLGDLQALQAGWYDDWAVGYAGYLVRSGGDDSLVDVGWPINRRVAANLE